MATRSVLVNGEWLTVEVYRFDELQNFTVAGGTWVGFATEFKIRGGPRDFLKVGVEPLPPGATPNEQHGLLNWLPKAAFVTLLSVLCGRHATDDRFIQISPRGPELLDPQRASMGFFRRRSRYDVLRVVAQRLDAPASNLELAPSVVHESSLITRLYESADIVSAFEYWQREGILLGLAFNNTCVIDENRDEDVVRRIKSYDWEECHAPHATQVQVAAANNVELHTMRTAGGHELPGRTLSRITVGRAPRSIAVEIKLPGATKWSQLGDIRIEDGIATLPVPLVFLSYAREDRGLVDKLADQLWNDGFLVWIDTRDLLPGDDWHARIDDAIEGADYVVVCLSKQACDKAGEFQRELKYALSQRELRPGGTRYIVPVLLERCDPPREFRDIQWGRLWEPDGYEKLKRALKCDQ